MIVITTMDSLPEHCFECPCHDGECGYCQTDRIHEAVDERPSWCPLKEIVRCKDCVFRDARDGMCEHVLQIREPDWFCADGERRDGDG